jgi:tRNA(fMet)-specific endonuclease VapC
MAKNEIILCDSTAIIHHFRGDRKVTEQLMKIGPSNIGISVITHAEIYYGARNKKDFEIYRRFFNALATYPLTEEISNIFNGLIVNYSISHKVRIADMLIAATAIANNLQIFTHNRKDFDFIPEIRLYNP